MSDHADTIHHKRADIELLREAAEGWPTPNPYTLACDQLQMSFNALLAENQQLHNALDEAKVEVEALHRILRDAHAAVRVEDER